MSPHPTKTLINRYPHLYTQNFDFHCHDGWFDLVDSLSAQITYHQELRGGQHLHIQKVKEKWGTLKINYEGGDQFTDGLISFCESFSSRICEVCGNPGTPIPKSWTAVRCKVHQ